MGEGWGEGTPRISATFPNTLTDQIQALRLVALSLALSHGREDGAAVRVKGSARKIGCADCFLFFRRPASTAVNPSCLSNRQIRCNLPLPRGGGLGRGHSPNFGNLSQYPQPPQIQALRLAALYLALSHGREDGVAVGAKVCCNGNKWCRLLFQTAFYGLDSGSLQTVSYFSIISVCCCLYKPCGLLPSP